MWHNFGVTSNSTLQLSFLMSVVCPREWNWFDSTFWSYYVRTFWKFFDRSDANQNISLSIYTWINLYFVCTCFLAQFWKHSIARGRGWPAQATIFDDDVRELSGLKIMPIIIFK